MSILLSSQIEKKNDYLDYTIIEDVTFMIRNVSYIPSKEFKIDGYIYIQKKI